jgi:alpha-N-acetylglucosaminidase
MKQFLFVVLLLCNGTAYGQANSDWKIPNEKEDFHVFLLMGQSNMTGGRPTYEDVPNLFFIPQQEKDWVPAQKGKMRSYALGVEFAKNYLETHPGVTVGLIPAAKGGASIGALHKGSTIYAQAMAKAATSMKSGVIKGVLWHQGESDTVHPHLAKAYEDKLLALVKDLRADLKNEKLPFVVGDLGEFYGTGKYHIKNIASIESLRKVLRGLPSKLPYTGYSDSTGCEHRGDFVHFDSKANVIRGKKYAAAFESAVADGKPKKDSAASPQNKATSKFATSAARGVLSRVMGEEKAGTIVLELLVELKGRDVYEYQSSGGKLIVRGSSPVAMCRGAYDYLRANNMGTVGWAGPRLRIPEAWPDAKLTRVETPFAIRHCYNVCTAGYTSPYWTWQRWEQELDWLAMHGYNMIMAPVATEAVATKVWKSLGLTQEEIDDFYTGPAHLPWQRMGNIQNVGGTLSPSWHRDQVALQKKLLARMRELGIEPVVQGFAGFVPKGIARVYPKSQLHQSAWGGFPEKSQSVSVMPDDPLFAKIMKLYMTEWKATFGDARYFLVDSFNEMELPKTGKPTTELLAGYGRNTYEAIKGGDPDAVWVLQGWMFYFQRNIWNRDTVKALLGAVPDDRLMILDYANDYVPTWGQFNAFDGKRWVMGYVPNMGGKTPYTGKMDFYAKQVARTLESPKRGNLTGFTISGEGLENNEVLYELMSDTAWTDQEIDLDDWLPRYVENRYGTAPQAVLDAWRLLREGVYSNFSSQPRFGWQTGGLGRGGVGSGAKFREAVQLFLSAVPDLGGNLNYRDDAVEMAAFALGARADECFLDASQAVGLKRPDVSRAAGERGFQLLLDLDRLLASHSFHRLDRWIDFARSHGDTEAEQDNYERNARQIVTMWGPPINDYSCRVWSGLVRDYYLPRVRMKLEEVRSGKRSNRSQWEGQWVSSKGLSKIEPFGDPVKAAAELVKKAYAEKPSRLDESVGPVIGRWSAADLKNRDWHTVEWDMPIDLLKDLQGVQFIYETGYSYLEIRSVELVGDGKQVAMDSHLGRTGGTNVKNFFDLRLPVGLLINNSCTLRAEFKSPTASSYGSIRAVTQQVAEDKK